MTMLACHSFIFSYCSYLCDYVLYIYESVTEAYLKKWDGHVTPLMRTKENGDAGIRTENSRERSEN